MAINPEKYGVKVISGLEPVWWVDRRRRVPGSNYIANEYCIRFGLLDSVYPGNVLVRCLEVDYKRTIDGIPVSDFQTPTDWKKLPRGWTWNTRLFEVKNNFNPFDDCKYDLLTQDGIRKAVEDGYLAETGSIDHSVFSTEVTKQGWRIVRDIYQQPYHPATMILQMDEVFDDGYEAQMKAVHLNDELYSTTEMSDHDYNVAELDELLNKIPFTDDEAKQRYREQILSLADFDDLEFRYSTTDGLQCKHWKRRRWYTIHMDQIM